MQSYFKFQVGPWDQSFVFCLQVKEAAQIVVGNNDDDGIAEAIERFIL